MAASPERAVTVVSLRLRTGTMPAGALKELHKEVSDLMTSAGVNAQWEDPTSYRDVNGSTVVVDLEGECSVPFHTEAPPPKDGTPIGSTVASDSHLLPFVNVNCSVLSALMAPYLANQPKTFREFVFGRAMGRVLAHELYHFVTQSEAHPVSGVAKAYFTANDLMKSRFEFDEMALDRVHNSPNVDSSPAALDSERGDGFTGETVDGK